MRLYSKIYGSGQPLIIIHGLFGMSDNWNTLGKRFAKYTNVHLIDLRNHGRSPHNAAFNYEVMCDDVLEYIENHNLVMPIILGHSLGGKVAMKFAFTYPHLLAKLIVADIAPRTYDTSFHKDLLEKLMTLELEQYEARVEVELALEYYFKDQGLRLFLMKNLFRNKDKKFAWRFNIEVLAEKVKNIQEADFVKGSLSVPTHFLRGGDSSYINTEDIALIRTIFLDVSIATLEGAGHWLHAQKPDAFYNEVMGFCLLD